MKVFLEKIALIFTIIASLLSILKDFGITFSKDSFTWIPSLINSILVWFYENVVLFEVNIWVLFIILYLAYKANKFYRNRDSHKDKNPINYYQEMSLNHQLIFNVVAKYHENNYDCMMDNLQRELREYKISNLEIEKIIEELENNFIIKSYPNFMAPTTYTLTEIGRNIAVELIKQTGQTK